MRNGGVISPDAARREQPASDTCHAEQMKQYNCVVHTLPDLVAYLDSPSVRMEAQRARSVLAQVYSGRMEPDWIASVMKVITDALPSVVLVGATTVGELAHGWTWQETAVLLLSFFESTDLLLFGDHCAPGEEFRVGSLLGSELAAIREPVAGLLMLSTNITVNASRVLSGLQDSGLDVPVIGGGAGDYVTQAGSFVMWGAQLSSQGVVAVAMIGRELHVAPFGSLGWQPLSREMTITSAEGMWVRSVDGEPAFEVYRRYLDIQTDDQFFLNALEFPFMMERDGEWLARVPVAVDHRGALQFFADVEAGQTFRLGYGNPGVIVSNARNVHAAMREFAPQAIFLYSCGCRRLLMQDDADLETRPFEAIAPTAGFYTSGEFYGRMKNGRLLNSALVAVGIREGAAIVHHDASPADVHPLRQQDATDPYKSKQSRVVSRLVHFVGAVTGELSAANRQNLELAQQKLELEHLRNEEQSRLLDMLNHEIKTPMSVIRLALGFDKRSAAVMQHANRAMMDMDAIVDRCLQINRLDQHRLEPALQPLRIRRLADEVREASQAPERIVLEGAPRIVLSSDPLLLRIVLGNLIDNALKYGRVDQPVRVGMTRQWHAGRDGVQVQVSNLPGTAGMPDGARVFEKYYRSPGAHGSSGSGLGLYLVRSVMELLGGWVRYSPTAGEVRFELWIPR